MYAHPLFPQIPQGVLPMVVTEGKNLLPKIIVNRADIFSQLVQSELRLDAAV